MYRKLLYGAKALILSCFFYNFTMRSVSVVQSLENLSTHLLELNSIVGPLLSEVTKEAVNAAAKKAQEAKAGVIQKAKEIKAVRSSMINNPSETKAVIVVDIQWDFVEQEFVGPDGRRHKPGSLAVADTGKFYIDAASKYINAARDAGYLIVFTQDFHPQNHVSFFSRWEGKTDDQGRKAAVFSPFNIPIPEGTKDQILWPDHCIQGTKGAEFVIEPEANDLVVKKGMNLNFDSYSGFKGRDNVSTGLEEALQDLNITELMVIGIATDYCVKFTVLDALATKKYKVAVIANLCRGVAIGSSEAALQEMKKNGAQFVWLDGIVMPAKLGAKAVDKIVNHGLTAIKMPKQPSVTQ
jgi:nicotinamidase/pyrazinamidase